jgi:NADH-quinone oxidoreductase subunit E
MELNRVDQIIERHDFESSALLAILQDIQGEANWLPREALDRVSEKLQVPIAHIYRMATFFHAFSLEPRGEHICTVCMGTACHVRGAPRLLDAASRELKLPDEGGTTEDMQFTVETVNCVGACALGPLLIVDGKYHGNMNPSGVEKLLRKMGKKPAKTNGEEIPEEVAE